MARVDQQSLLAGAVAPEDVLVHAYAHVIADRCDPSAPNFVPRLGLSSLAFMALLRTHFARFSPTPDWLSMQRAELGRGGALEEFDDLRLLLLEHGNGSGETHVWIAHLIASACMGDNHLWQDLGLPDRKALRLLMAMHFPTLAEKNNSDMKWKKFFYRQLCERAEVAICKAPSCGVCSDHGLCFGGEQG